MSIGRPGRNDELIAIVRGAYIAARRRFDGMSGKNGNYTPSAKLEGDMSVYETFIKQALRHGFNPLQYIYATMQRIYEVGYSSDAPSLQQMTAWNTFDPNRLESQYEAITRSAIKTAFQLVDLNSVMNAEVYGISDSLEVMAANNEADPVVLFVLHLASSKKVPSELRDAAKTAYAVCPEVYEADLKKRGHSLPAFATFEDWINE